MKLSIVVPVYNTAKFLGECVESLAEDLPKDCEIVLIDNGSTDGSLELCREFAEKYKFVRVLKCARPGAAAVRNFGMKQVRGEYVWFVDSDDYVRRGAAREILAVCVRSKAEVVLIGAQKVTETGEEIAGGVLGAVRPEVDKHWRQRFVRYGLAPWQVICQREWLIKNALFYDEGMIHEDMAIISSYILYTDKVASVEKPVYYYRQRKGSVLHGGTWSERELDIFPALELLAGRFEKVGKFNKYKAELEWFYIWNLLDDAAREFVKFPEGRREFAEIRRALRSRFPKWRRNKYFRDCALGVRLRCRLAYHGIVQ